MGSYAAGAGLAKEKQQKFVNFGKAFLGLGGARGALAKWERSWAAGKKGMCSQTGLPAQLRQLCSPGQVSERQLGAGCGTLIAPTSRSSLPCSQGISSAGTPWMLWLYRGKAPGVILCGKTLRVLRDQLGWACFLLKKLLLVLKDVWKKGAWQNHNRAVAGERKGRINPHT